MAKLLTIAVSTRDGRQGMPIVQWAHEAALAHGGFEAELVDLGTIGLPLFNEANHPRLRKYEHEHTKRWSEIVEAADAFVFVTPEYNYFAPPSLVNAIDYLATEWAYKPAAFVSYGGVSGGLRSVQSVKPLLTTLKIVPLPESVTIPFFAKSIADGRFSPNELQTESVKGMLDELARWTEALRPLRQS